MSLEILSFGIISWFPSVTENGFAVKDEDTMPLEQALNDTDRVHYFEGTTRVLLQATHEDGVDVKAYFPWSKIRSLQGSFGY